MFRVHALAAVLTSVLTEAVLAQSKPTEPLKPLTVVVVDAETGTPIPAFDYFYYVEAASGYTAGGGKWTAAKCEAGTITLDLPVSCHLTFAARAPGYVYDTLYIQHYPIKAEDAERRINHLLQRGMTITGRVIDAATSQPVAGVRISPVVFHNPGFDPDHDRSVFSQPDGRFEIAGIDPELGRIEFAHPDYLAAGWHSHDVESNTTRPISGITVQLKVGETIFGVVRGPEGKPIEGATVDSGDDKTTQTAADGRFRIRGVRKHWNHADFYVEVRKPGYMRYWKTPHDLPDEGFQITLEPLFEIRGRVANSSGQPVKHFAVMAGPGKNPANFECAHADITDAEGRFALAIDTDATWLGGTAADGAHIESRHWLGVWSDGYAVWEDWVPFDRSGASVAVTLLPGVNVSARLNGVGAGFQGRAVLVPDRVAAQEYMITENAAQRVGSLTTTVNSDGSIRFAHVRPDRYVLHISGSGVTPRAIALEVPNQDLELGAMDVQAAGRIVGRIFNRDGQPWGFADGVLYHPALGAREARYFKAAEGGGFVLEDVPAGDARVGAEYRGGDIIRADLVNVHVEAGKTAEVAVNSPDRSRDVKFQFVIGDGAESQRKTGTGMAAKRLVDNVTTREPAFSIELEPTTSGIRTLPEISEWCTPDSDGLVTLPDVPAGKYRLRVSDWLMSCGFCDGLLYETEIDVRPSAEPIRVPLGAGAITGQLKVSNTIRRMPQVIAVETQGKTHPRRARCDYQGNFCVRYLPPGEYVLYGHEDANGCCRLPAVRVANDVTDVGEHTLAGGAAIRGAVRLARPTSPPTAVLATDANGVTLEALDFKGHNGEDYAISNIWAGNWTVALMRDSEVVAQKTVSLGSHEVVTVDLTVE